jgi:Na+-driven multidrug efflux pump
MPGTCRCGCAGPSSRYLKPDPAELRWILAKGLPMGAQMLVMSAAGIIVVGLVNREGMMTTAAYGAAMQLFTYIQMPAMAIGGAISAIAAQYIGAGKWDSLDKVTRAGVWVNFAMTGALTVILLLFDRPALVLFLGPESPAVDMARHIQLLASWNFILFGVTMVMTATMRAGGAVWAPLMVLLVSLFPVRLGFYWLTYDWLGADAIWLSFPVAALAALVLAWWAYRFTRWRERAQGRERGGEARERPRPTASRRGGWSRMCEAHPRPPPASGRGEGRANSPSRLREGSELATSPCAAPALDGALDPFFLAADFRATGR